MEQQFQPGPRRKALELIGLWPGHFPLSFPPLPPRTDLEKLQKRLGQADLSCVGGRAGEELESWVSEQTGSGAPNEFGL